MVGDEEIVVGEEEIVVGDEEIVADLESPWTISKNCGRFAKF